MKWTRALRRLFRRVRPRMWGLRTDLRKTDRYFRPRIATAKGDERQRLIEEHVFERANILDDLEALQTQWLLRRAWHYYGVAPEIPYGSADHEDEHWKQGYVTDTWHLKPAAVASLRRQIEEAKGRRREAWATWAKLLIGLLTVATGLVSALVSFILASKR